MTEHAAHLINKLANAESHAEPWPHFTADDFLPPGLFAELLAALPRLRLGPRFGEQRQRVTEMPKALWSLLHDRDVIDFVRGCWGFSGGKVLAEVAWFGTQGYPIHSDRHDKLWNGQVYLAGDERGTELFDESERLAKVVEWRPNRFAGWLPPGGGKKHAAPKSEGRYVLLWWILRDKADKARAA